MFADTNALTTDEISRASARDVARTSCLGAAASLSSSACKVFMRRIEENDLSAVTLQGHREC